MDADGNRCAATDRAVAGTTDLVNAIQQAEAGQRKLDGLRQHLDDLRQSMQTPPPAHLADAPWNVQAPKTSPCDEGHEGEGSWEAWDEGSWEAWDEGSWEAWDEGSWDACKEGGPRVDGTWAASASSSSACAWSAAPASAEANAMSSESAWYATKQEFEGNGRAVAGQQYRPRPLGGETGDKPPRWGNRGGKKSAYFTGWHAAKKRGPEALTAYEAEHRSK
jgi:hypothetical protein